MYLDLEEQIVEKFQRSFVKKRETQLVFPSFSIKINQDSKDDVINDNINNQLLSELILYNLKMDFSQYLDYRKDIVLRSKTFYILYKEYNIE